VNGSRSSRKQTSGQQQHQRVFKIAEHVRVTYAADGAAVLDILRGQMYRLNRVGSKILELLDLGSGESEIATKLQEEFGINGHDAATDVCEFVRALESHQLVIARTGAFSPEQEYNCGHS
jgi:hypothetical protein